MFYRFHKLNVWFFKIDWVDCKNLTLKLKQHFERARFEMYGGRRKRVEVRVVVDDDKYFSIRSSYKKNKKRGATKIVNSRFGTVRLSAHERTVILNFEAHERTVPMALHYGYNARPLSPHSG